MVVQDFNKFRDIRLHKLFERVLPDGAKRKYVGFTRNREDPPDDGVLTVYQLRDVKNDVQEAFGYIEIVSDSLQAFVREALKGYPEPGVEKSPVKIWYPYYSLIHRHVDISRLASVYKGTPEETKHLRHLEKFIWEELKDQVKEFDSLNAFSSDISFPQLWTCFVPGQIVIQRDGVQYEDCYEITDIQYTDCEDIEVTFFLIFARQCQYWKGQLGYSRSTVFPLRYFPGLKALRAFDWIPLKARHDWEEFQQQKIKDGHNWWRTVSGSTYHHAQYEGVAYTNDELLFPYRRRPYKHWRIGNYEDTHKEFKPFHVSGEIMLDSEAFTEANPRSEAVFSGYIEGSISEKGFVFKDEYALISPARVAGFAFEEKIWALFQVSKVQPVHWSKDAYRDLQIDLFTKKLLLDLVSSHQLAETTEEHDAIPGKGNGLIFLLHGSPGTGKTFTAQAMAHYTNRPLYATTSGELSKNKSLERNLRDALRWSRRWKAIFLLDEADIFLAKRDVGSDMKRNETVTIFLQQIEYSSGIMFLSTNRVGDFDPAFMNRIHLPIKFGKLEDWQRQAIWRSRLGERLKLKDDELNALVKAGNTLSGRDIRNIVQMAIQLGKVVGNKVNLASLLDLVSLRVENMALCMGESEDVVDPSAEPPPNGAYATPPAEACSEPL